MRQRAFWQNDDDVLQGRLDQTYRPKVKRLPQFYLDTSSGSWAIKIGSEAKSRETAYHVRRHYANLLAQEGCPEFPRQNTAMADEARVFICPICNSKVMNPMFRPSPWWAWRRKARGASVGDPVCANGHRLRNGLLGDLRQVSAWRAFLRGFLVCGAALCFALVEDALTPATTSDWRLRVFTATGLLVGALTFHYAWKWGVRSGPVHRLATRAVGVALGFLAPALVASHALYFEWAPQVQTVCAHGLWRAAAFVVNGY